MMFFIGLTEFICLIGFVLAIIMMIVQAVRKKQAWQWAVCLGICILLLAVCIALTPEKGKDEIQVMETQTEAETEAPKTEAVTETPKTEPVMDVPKTEAVTEAPKTEPVTEIPKTEAVTEALETTAEPEITESAKATENTETATVISDEEMIQVIKNSLACGFSDNNYDVNLEGTVYTVNVWHDGLATEAYFAKSGIKEHVEQWERVTEATAEASESLCMLLAANGHENQTAMVNILNDINHENILVTAYLGLVVYDCVAE